MFENEPDGATPVDDDEVADLIPKHVRTRAELNVWEQENILTAATWAQDVKKSLLEEEQIRALHRRMFDKTWKWAGKYRLSDKNIGVPWPHIQIEIRKLLDDARFWIENETFSMDEIAVRLHHRMVLIHPFPNGNGRHARLWSDTILVQNGRPPLNWKNSDLDHPGEGRSAYIAALRAADRNDYEPLITLILRGRD
jgi:Fic-DOC domain mobile mystery protein B